MVFLCLLCCGWCCFLGTFGVFGIIYWLSEISIVRIKSRGDSESFKSCRITWQLELFI